MADILGWGWWAHCRELLNLHFIGIHRFLYVNIFKLTRSVDLQENGYYSLRKIEFNNYKKELWKAYDRTGDMRC